MNFFTRVMLGLSPVLANAGALYDLTVRPVDQSNLAHVLPTAPTPAVTEYFVEDGKVRVGGAYAKSVFIFKDRTIYVIDKTSRTVHVLKHATLSEVAAHYADEVKQLEETAASAPAEERAEAQRKAAAMREVSDRMRQPVPRDYRVTVRIESVDGHPPRRTQRIASGHARWLSGAGGARLCPMVHAVNQALPDSGVSAHSNGTTGARLARAAHPVRPARV
jgi:hypothetical protein